MGFEDWRRGSESNRRIKVLQTSQGRLCLFVYTLLLLYFQQVNAFRLQPV